MTNPANAIKMLITYAVVIPLAIMVGYLLTDPLDYGSMGLFGILGSISASVRSFVPSRKRVSPPQPLAA
jgi:hypothetical protein